MTMMALSTLAVGALVALLIAALRWWRAWVRTWPVEVARR